jgi:hypothetical protein
MKMRCFLLSLLIAAGCARQPEPKAMDYATTLILAHVADEIVLGDTQANHQNERYVWTISKERVATLPVWHKGAALPLSPQQAEAIAYAWTRRQTIVGFIPDRPSTISLVQFQGLIDNTHPAPFPNRYFYKVHFGPPDGKDRFWTVHVLMDGSIVEPTKKEPNQPQVPTAPGAAAHQ